MKEPGPGPDLRALQARPRNAAADLLGEPNIWWLLPQLFPALMSPSSTLTWVQLPPCEDSFCLC